MNKYSARSGQTLIEAAIALASIILVLGAIAVAVTTSLTNSQFIKNQTLAAKLSQQGMEKINYLKNTESPDTFFNRTGLYCMGQSGTLNVIPGVCNAAEATDIIDETFKREVEFHKDSVECGTRPTTAPSSDPQFGMQVEVTVWWSSGRCTGADSFCHKSQLISCFSNESQSGFTL